MWLFPVLYLWYSIYILLGEIDGFVQDCSNSIANALELLQSCTKPPKWTLWIMIFSFLVFLHLFSIKTFYLLLLLCFARCFVDDIDGLVPNCSNTSALALVLLLSGTEPLTWVSGLLFENVFLITSCIHQMHTHYIIHLFSTVRQHRWVKVKIRLSCTVNTLVADDLVKIGARASVAWNQHLSWNTLYCDFSTKRIK